jgi:DUF971 family protein
VSLVGQYALQIAFESGHATGLYTFSLLRGLGGQDREDPKSAVIAGPP